MQGFSFTPGESVSIASLERPGATAEGVLLEVRGVKVLFSSPLGVMPREPLRIDSSQYVLLGEAEWTAAEAPGRVCVEIRHALRKNDLKRLNALWAGVQSSDGKRDD
jgi:hypothetical protein